MFFAKDEVIEINDEKSYLVLNTTIMDNEIFYQIGEIDETGINLVGTKSIILAVNDNGTLLIEDVTNPEVLTKLEEVFAG